MTKQWFGVGLSLVVALSTMPAVACPARRGWDVGEIRETDNARVIAKVAGTSEYHRARLEVEQVIYGRPAAGPLTMGRGDRPEERVVTVGGCGPNYRWVEDGTVIVANLGVLASGEPFVRSWDPLDEAARAEPRLARYLRARSPAERRRLGTAMRPRRGEALSFRP